MLFSANVPNADVFREISYALSFVRKTCLFMIEKERLTIVSITDSGMQVWAHLDTSEILSHMRLRSLEGARIAFELPLDIFVRAMKSFATGSFGVGSQVKMKLVKRNDMPYIMLSVDGRSTSDGRRAKIVQTIPIRIYKFEQLKATVEPELHDADVLLFTTLQLPSILKICERYRNLGPKVEISANNAGILRIGVQNDHVKVDTKWTGLAVAQDTTRQEVSEADLAQRDPDEFASVLVDAKELYSVLRIHPVVMQMVLCITDRTSLSFIVNIAGLDEANNITYYVSTYNR
ncbi:checkpoint protein Hus1/Mec3 [Limtongia smithiae]|uniref:checkpoint protein Hus1/Mec3 n=1 Tax=Limtongia smithiae TaxID=1125753 RepID=UPI0034CF78F2